jgi:hypothetical protein
MSGFSRQPEPRTQTAAQQQIERDLPWLPAPALRHWWRQQIVCPLADPVRQVLNDGFALVMLLVFPVGVLSLMLIPAATYLGAAAIVHLRVAGRGPRRWAGIRSDCRRRIAGSQLRSTPDHARLAQCARQCHQA